MLKKAGDNIYFKPCSTTTFVLTSQVRDKATAGEGIQGDAHSQAVSHSGLLITHWIFEPRDEKHVSSHGSKVEYAVKKVEQGNDDPKLEEYTIQ